VGCELTVIRDGAGAIKYIDEADEGLHPCPDLIILDLNLPKKSGQVVLQHVRAGINCKNTRVVILTSSNSQKDKDAVADYDPAMYIRKPSDLDEFLMLGAVFKRLLHPIN